MADLVARSWLRWRSENSADFDSLPSAEDDAAVAAGEVVDE